MQIHNIYVLNTIQYYIIFVTNTIHYRIFKKILIILSLKLTGYFFYSPASDTAVPSFFVYFFMFKIDNHACCSCSIDSNSSLQPSHSGNSRSEVLCQRLTNTPPTFFVSFISLPITSFDAAGSRLLYW